MLYLILIFFSIFFYLWCRVKIWRFERCTTSIPSYKTYTFLGDYQHFVLLKRKESSDILELFTQAGKDFQEYGIAKTVVGPLCAVWLFNPTYIELIANNPNASRKGAIYKYMLNPKVLNGLFVNVGDSDLKELRRPLMMSMKKKYLETRHQELFAKHGLQLIDRLNMIEGRTNILHEIERAVGSLFVEVNLLVFLAIHPEIQEQLYQEQMSVFGDDASRVPSPEDIRKMDLWDRSIKEALRIVSNPFIQKQATADIKLETHLGIDAKDFREWCDFLPTFFEGFIQSKVRGFARPWQMPRFLFKYGFVPDLVKKTEKCLQFIVDYRRKKMSHASKDERSSDYEYYTDCMIRRGEARNFTDQRIGSEILDLIGAGMDTCSPILSSLLVFLAIHPEIQEQLYQEQMSVFGDDASRVPSPEDIRKMDLLDRSIKEALRLVSNPFIHKQATADIKLGQHLIPKDVFVMVFTRQLHRDTKLWERPNEFFPDHFLPEKVKERHDFAFIPFGIGIRRCPGERFAKSLLAVKTSLLIRNFKFSTYLKHENELVYKFNVMCGFETEYYELMFEKRNK